MYARTHRHAHTHHVDSGEARKVDIIKKASTYKTHAMFTFCFVLLSCTFSTWTDCPLSSDKFSQCIAPLEIRESCLKLGLYSTHLTVASVGQRCIVKFNKQIDTPPRVLRYDPCFADDINRLFFPRSIAVELFIIELYARSQSAILRCRALYARSFRIVLPAIPRHAINAVTNSAR